jgi:ubiquinone/menaquinone biosynthesis C-methylase UbiE
MKLGWKKTENEWRKQLLSYAKGKVLEISVGEGINFEHYPPQVNATVTDMSARMIEKAKQLAIENGIKAEFIVSREEDLQFEPHSFDTIVSIFSLCAYGDPVQVLNQFNTWCKPDGTILIMEHGLSKYGIGRFLQRLWEPYHYRKTGCHLNMDIKTILENSAPRIKRVERKLGGIIYMIWASPAQTVNRNRYLINNSKNNKDSSF